MPKHTRRRFFQVAGGAVAALATAGRVRAQKESKKPNRKIPFELGLASYSLRKVSLDDALKMTQRVGLKNICLKSFHLPLDATPDQIAEAAGKVEAAGIDLYGGWPNRSATSTACLQRSRSTKPPDPHASIANWSTSARRISRRQPSSWMGQPPMAQVPS